MSSDIDSAVRPFVRPIVKAGLALLSLLVIRIFVTVLPGLENTVPSTELTVAQVVSAVIGVLMVGVVAWVGLRIHSTGKSSDNRIVQATARGARLIILLLTVLLLHTVLKPIVTPFLTPQPGIWTFDLAFLLIALVPLGLLGYRMVTNLDALTDSIVDSLSGLSSLRSDGGMKRSSETQDGTDDDTTTCDSCGTDVPADGAFCPNCGTQF
ncbi:zinc ribbon domain-containing protein [Halosegnis longus]|uniref:zinc ribbon domain-containing protein n=1 Tax=Halosegnis longus TaxID=2216012 RepID=UPI00096A3636|nr:MULTISPECIES: zinc ribbon domain-containing protein [Halobacteriales]